MLERATDRLEALMLRGWPALAQADARLLAESVVRLAISHAALPSEPASVTGRRVAALLGPYIERALQRGDATG